MVNRANGAPRNRSSTDSRICSFVRWARSAKRAVEAQGLIWTVVVHVKTSKSAVVTAPLLGDDRRGHGVEVGSRRRGARVAARRSLSIGLWTAQPCVVT